MDFGFGANTGLSSNAPYTTIASNPMFMSFASTFDSFASPEASSSTSAPTPGSNFSGNTSNSNSLFNFDMSNLSTWPASTPQQDGFLDDLFSGYMTGANPLDLATMQTNSPNAISPVAHHLTPGASNIRSPLSNGASSSSSSPSMIASPSSFLTHRDTPPTDRNSPTIVHNPDTCPKSKQELQERIHQEGPSPFAPTSLRKSSDSVLGTMISCAGTNFPKTAKSDQNIEVLSAWRSIRADPKFKDADIAELCSEFTSKARCDGTKVVLEPQGVSSILQSLSKKQ